MVVKILTEDVTSILSWQFRPRLPELQCGRAALVFEEEPVEVLRSQPAVG